LIENRHKLLVDGRVGEANGTAEHHVTETIQAGEQESGGAESP